MDLEKNAYLVGGRKGPKTKEKIRLKLRYLLNSFSKCVIGISDAPHDNQKFYFEQKGYRYLAYVYKSSSLETAQFFVEFFRDLYVNELEVDESSDQINEDAKHHFIYLVGKKKKKAF